MEVRAGHEAGVAQRADEVAARHAVAHRNQDVPQMRVAAAPVGVVLDANDVRPMRVGDMRHHRPVGDGDDRSPRSPPLSMSSPSCTGGLPGGPGLKGCVMTKRVTGSGCPNGPIRPGIGLPNFMGEADR